MERLEMLREAQQLAHEQVDASGSLNDARFAELEKIEEDKAISLIACEILEDALLDLGRDIGRDLGRDI